LAGISVIVIVGIAPDPKGEARFGEHTANVLRKTGFSEAEIMALITNGAAYNAAA